jgi:hypothetical protein
VSRQPRHSAVPLDRRRGFAEEDHCSRGGACVSAQRRAAGAPLDCDLCSVTGCPARGGRPSALAGVATGRWRGTGRGRVRASVPAAAAAPAGLPPERARQRCRPVTAECPPPRPVTAGRRADPARRMPAACATSSGPRPSVAGAEGALEAVEKVLTDRRHTLPDLLDCGSTWPQEFRLRLYTGQAR